MNLYEIIQLIPHFVEKMVNRKASLTEPESCYGKFHLGLQYDINIWLSNQSCGVYPSQEEKIVTGQGQGGLEARRVYLDK